MYQESKTEILGIQQRVINHLQRADWLFIILPMLLPGILLIIVPLVWSIIERANSNPTEIGGFNFDGLLIIAGVIFCSVFCGCYGILALFLSLVTHRNITFRTLLIVIPVLAAVGFYIFFILQNSADYAQYFEKKRALRFER